MTNATKTLTIFGLPKPFEGHIGKIQTNAIGSWTRLGAEVQVLLFGDEVGTDECARRWGCEHIADIQRNEFGTPLLDDVFATANRCAEGTTLLYANCDIVFGLDLIHAVKQLQDDAMSDYLMIGRRIDFDYEQIIDFERQDWHAAIEAEALRAGKLAPVVCKDYFGFPKGSYNEIPAFAIGRGNWDNWMVYHANSRRVPVVDATEQVTAIHQNHGYGHLKRGRLEAYVNGDEAVANKKLAGGTHLISGCAATWKLTDTGPVRLRRPRSLAFVRDLPRFIGLLGNLFVSGKASSDRSCQESVGNSGGTGNRIAVGSSSTVEQEKEKT